MNVRLEVIHVMRKQPVAIQWVHLIVTVMLVTVEMERIVQVGLKIRYILFMR